MELKGHMRVVESDFDPRVLILNGIESVNEPVLEGVIARGVNPQWN